MSDAPRTYDDEPSVMGASHWPSPMPNDADIRAAVERLQQTLVEDATSEDTDWENYCPQPLLEASIWLDILLKRSERLAVAEAKLAESGARVAELTEALKDVIFGLEYGDSKDRDTALNQARAALSASQEPKEEQGG